MFRVSSSGGGGEASTPIPPPPKKEGERKRKGEREREREREREGEGERVYVFGATIYLITLTENHRLKSITPWCHKNVKFNVVKVTGNKGTVHGA